MSEERRCPEGEALVTYLYDEADLAERVRVERHLAGCTLCRDEVEALGGVRRTLGEWKPPAEALGFRLVRDPVVVPIRRPWYSVPRWAPAAAAALVLAAAAAAIARLDVRYDQGTLVVRTGWQAGAQKAGQPAAAPGAAAPWRAELAALERQLRTELRAGQVAGAGAAMPPAAMTDEEFVRRMDVALRSGRVRVLPAPGVNDEQLVRKVESLIQASEAKQQRALSDWLVRLNAELPALRQADLYRFIRDVEIQNRPGIMTVPVASLRK